MNSRKPQACVAAMRADGFLMEPLQGEWDFSPHERLLGDDSLGIVLRLTSRASIGEAKKKSSKNIFTLNTLYFIS